MSDAAAIADEITPERLASLFRPRGVALVGASDKSNFSAIAYANLQAAGLDDRTFLVNPRSAQVHGRATLARCVDIADDVDVAFLMVPRALTLDAMTDAAAAGIRNAVVLSSGYGEAGHAGVLAQADLVAHARSLGMLLLGPNHLGFANFVDGIPVAAITHLPTRSGDIALVSQSGASAGAMLEFAVTMGHDLSHLVTLGNEAMITAAHVLDFLIEDDATKAIAVFLETIRAPEAFRNAARRAARIGKPIVVLKAGSSAIAARTAAAHTGAVVGDDGVIDAVFRESGVIRVDTIEDMIITAGLAAHTGPLEEGGLGVVSISGGACDIIADRAEDARLALPSLADETIERLRAFMPSYGTTQNPLDITGAAVIDRTLFTKAIMAIAADPGICVVAVVNSLPWRDLGAWSGLPGSVAIGAGIANAEVPAFLVNQVMLPVSAYAREQLDASALPMVVSGLAQAVTAVGAIIRWSERHREILDDTVYTPRPTPRLPEQPRGTWSEYASRALLDAAGIPVVPSRLVRTTAEASAVAREWTGPLAVKVVSPDIAHKSDIGGVVLGVEGVGSVSAAFEAVVAAGAAVDGARVDGALITPMRAGGIELLIGVIRDPQWGPILAVAAGGTLVEILDDSVLVPLPVTAERVHDLLAGLRIAPLLGGFRGASAADIGALARTIAAIGDTALSLGEDLESLEVNPLRVDGEVIEALDALVTWRDPSF